MFEKQPVYTIKAYGKAEGLAMTYGVLAIATPYKEGSDEPDTNVTVYTVPYGSVSTVNDNNEFSIQPNPTSDYIEITVGTRHALSLQNIEIYNVFGTKVEHPPTPSFQEGELRVDVSGLAAGVYFVRVGNKVLKFMKI